MNQYQTERRLTQLYGLLVALLGTSAICIAIAFNHWRAILDVCPSNWLENTNCGCIFYGVSTYRYFQGGHNSYCHYAIFAPLPILVYAGIMALFHMYRVCINNVGQYEDEKTTNMEEIEAESIVVTSRTRVSQSNDAVLYCWVPSAVFAAVFAVYNLVHASIVTDGFLRTCKQYRGQLVKTLPASGNHATALHFRLQCQAIFDFMDYLHQNVLVSPQTEYINTGAALQIALIATWVSVFLWICIVVLTSQRAYRERNVLTCCGN